MMMMMMMMMIIIIITLCSYGRLLVGITVCMSTQYRLVQSGKTASGGCSAGQGSSEL
jgi:hypothetical protein